jgi:hypothetical protein
VHSVLASLPRAAYHAVKIVRLTLKLGYHIASETTKLLPIRRDLQYRSSERQLEPRRADARAHRCVAPLRQTVDVLEPEPEPEPALD